MAYFKAKEDEARALLLNAPVSRKYGNELARVIKGKTYEKTKVYLNDIIEKKRYLPLRKHNRKVGHRKGMEGNVKSGRYPMILAKHFLKAIELAKANAENKGLDISKLKIESAVVQEGVRRHKIQPGGRRRMRRSKSAHIEILLKSKKVKKKETKKTSKKENVKKEVKKKSQ